MRIQALGCKLYLFAFVTVSAVLNLPLTAAAQICNSGGGVCVTTWQQDTGVPDVSAGGVYRTGENLTESTIVASNLNGNTFGQLCSTDVGGVAQLDGQVYAQPLVLTNVTINTQRYPYIVYVVTQNDTIYAIDGTPTVGTNCKIRNSYPFLTTSGSVIYGQTAVPCTDFANKPCGTIQPSVGILGTPVIDQTTNTIYLVTQSTDGSGNFYHYLHALDVQTFAPKFNGPVLICPTQPCTNGSTFSLAHIQRPALLLANCGSACGNQNYVYVAFSMMDGTTAQAPPNGAIFGYQASDLSIKPQLFQTSLGGQSGSNGGGIWMGGAGPAFGPDVSGNNWIYVTTANGTFDQATNWGDSFLKLKPANLTVPASNGYLTPSDENYRQDIMDCKKYGGGDVDFGSGGVTLIPDNELTYPGYGHMAVNGEKEGDLWFISRDAPGGFTQGFAQCQMGGGGPNVQTYAVNSGAQVIHNNIAFWESESGALPTKPFVYVAPQNAKGMGSPNYLFQFTLCSAVTDSSPICGSTPSATANLACCTYGITPTISSAPQALDAIVWGIEKTDGGCSEQDLGPSCPTKPNGILYAFDAVSLAQLYSSSTCSADQINQATKFSVPTVANGKVYVGTQSNNTKSPGMGTLYIFGPLSRSGC